MPLEIVMAMTAAVCGMGAGLRDGVSRPAKPLPIPRRIAIMMPIVMPSPAAVRTTAAVVAAVTVAVAAIPMM
jgi:hypothetical protein